MDVYISLDAPDVTRNIREASSQNAPEDVRRLDQGVDLSRAIWKSWALKSGGSVLSETGPAVRLQMPADYVDELQDLKTQYGNALDSRVAIGLGTELQHADRALQAALKLGGNLVLPYSEYVEEALEDQPERSELPIVKSQGPVAMNPGAFSGASRPSAPVAVDRPAGSQGEHSEAQDVYDLINDDERPPAPEGTHAAADLESMLHGHAQRQEGDDRRKAMQNSEEVRQTKLKVAKALQLLQAQAPVMEQVKQSSPDAYGAMVGLAQAVVELARQLRGGDDRPMAKSESDGPFEEPLAKMALIHDDPTKPMMVWRVEGPNGEGPYGVTANEGDCGVGVPPGVYCSAQLRHDQWVGKGPWSSRGPNPQPHPKLDFTLEERAQLTPEHRYGFRNRIDARKWFGDTALKDMAAQGFQLKQVPARHVILSRSGRQVAYLPHVEMTKDELEKAKLPMPESSAHHHQILPVGSMVSPKMKVQHGDGSTSWIQAKAGIVRSKDGHPISSRNQNGR